MLELLKKSLKSKTIDSNLVAAALIKILAAFGVMVPLDVVLAGFVILNVILRLITNSPISEK